jgi:hypothetical protein
MAGTVNVALLVIGNGRDFIHHTIEAVDTHVSYPLSDRLMVNDCPRLEWREMLEGRYPDFTIAHVGGQGMAKAVQAGFDLVLAHDADYVLWIEEDMLVVRDLPVAAAVEALENNPRLAQMGFPRDHPDPTEGDDQLGAILSQADNWGDDCPGYVWHDYLFSMFPCVIPRRVLELGWPAGPIGVGNEAGMTARTLDAGYVFGCWGHVRQEPFARHVGYADRAASYAL